MKHFSFRFLRLIKTISIGAAALSLLISCTSRISVSAESDGSADIALNIDAGQAVGSVLKAVSGQSSIIGIIPPAKFKSMLETKDFSQVQASSSSATGITASGVLCPAEKQTERFGNSTVMARDFVNCGSGSLTVTLDAHSLQALAESLPEEQRNYLDLLMAPVFTGEELSGEEYLDLIGAFYGDTLADEIKASALEVYLSCPAGKKISGAAEDGKSIAGWSKSSAAFSIPLADLFTMTQKKTFSISW